MSKSDNNDYYDYSSNFKPILIGALGHDYNSKQLLINKYLNILYEYYETDDIDIIYNKSPFIGFVITPPTNINNQKEIEQCLSEIIELNKKIPFILYQLPQITNCEINIETVKSLISRFGNIIMIKDSSGNDKILKSQQSLDGVFMIRGAEGNQIQSLININDYGINNGYNGLLLSTANNYPKLLNKLIISLKNYNWNDAQKISDLITKISYETFNIVNNYKFDNPFTNSAKMVDFFMAFGDKYSKKILNINDNNIPINKDGIKYNIKDMMTIMDILSANNILNDVGYLNENRKWYKKQ